MRFIYLAQIILFATLQIFSSPLFAFEVEEKRTYKSANPQGTLRIISTADVAAFEPLILAFKIENPNIDVEYTVTSSTELMTAIYEDGASFDVAISSAMDLQTKLANDGFAQSYQSTETDQLPDWAHWRNQIFGFTQEPAVMVVSDKAFAGFPIPTTRGDLINILRENPDHFDGRIGTYDVRSSGLGYLFATQDSRNTDSFWRLIEIMGRVNAKLYCCSGAMISDVAKGDLAFAYNVLGSYADAQVKTVKGITVVPLQDFQTVMLRTVLIPATSKNADLGGKMIDFLVRADTQSTLAQMTGLPPIKTTVNPASKSIRPIRLGPGLLVFLDRLKRETFITNWQNSITQQ